MRSVTSAEAGYPELTVTSSDPDGPTRSAIQAATEPPWDWVPRRHARFMERSAYRRSTHIERRRHDIGTDPLPEQAFDLIHARLVLQHVPQRHDALAELVAALRPRC